MLFVSNDKQRFITTTEDGSICFTRGQHLEEGKRLGLDLSKMDNAGMAYFYQTRTKKLSIKEFLNN